MPALMTAVQFVASCLVLGLGLFLAARAAVGVHPSQLLPAIGVRTIAGLGGVLLLAAGGYAALLTIPL